MSVLALENITVGGLLRKAAQKYPDNIAMVYGDFSINYKEMDATVDIFARKLISAGIKKGDHVGVLCETSPVEVMTKYALCRIGAIACLLNTGLKRNELTGVLSFSDITTLFVGDSYQDVDYLDMCIDICSKFEKPIQVLHIEHPENQETAPIEKLREMESAVDTYDTAFMLYTSGTTGPIKAVMGSHYSRVNCGIMQARDLGANEKDVFLCALPSFHCFSLSVNIMAACACGGCLCIPKNRHTGELLNTIEKYRCTMFSCVPTLFHAIISRPDFKNWDTSSVRAGIIGGSLCTKELFYGIEKKFGMTLLSSLGQTEATAGLTISELTDPLELRAETVGHFMEHLEGKIVNPETGEEMPTGQSGEICVKGYVVMQGYYKMPEATSKTIDKDGWLHTGDLGYLDENKYLHLSGRIKDLIIRGGENISPFEIESQFADDERVRNIKAIGVPDTHYGEEICLCIEPKEGSDLTKEEVVYTISKNLASYKAPKYVIFLDKIPANTTGKIKTGELKDIALKRLHLAE